MVRPIQYSGHPVGLGKIAWAEVGDEGCLSKLFRHSRFDAIGFLATRVGPHRGARRIALGENLRRLRDESFPPPASIPSHCSREVAPGSTLADVGRRLPNSCDEDVYFEWYSVSRMSVLRLARGNHTLEHKMATDRCRESRPSSTVSEPASLLTTGPDEPCRECQGRKSGSRAGFRLDSNREASKSTLRPGRPAGGSMLGLSRL